MKIFAKQSVRFYVNVVAVLALIAFVGHMMPSQQTFAKDVNESTYDRVLRTNTIRCGYSSWAPLFSVDAKTGAKSGIFYDLMEEAAKRLELKIEWTEEIGWGSVVESVKTGRVDMACAGYWPSPARIKNLQTTVPQIYAPMYVYVRESETRNFVAPEVLNNAQYAVTTIDGSAETQIVAKRFTASQNLKLPELSTSADAIQNLLTNKSDFLVLDAGTANEYIAANPGKIKQLFPDKPMVIFPTAMLVPAKDMAFKGMLDNILLDIEHDGTLDAILKKYDSKGIFLRNQPPA